MIHGHAAPHSTAPALPEVDIELLLEGSYPYVLGGVSSWVHWLIQGMPDVRFGLTHLAANRKEELKSKYALPDNVQYLQNIYLQEGIFLPPDHRGTKWEKDHLYEELFQLHHSAGKDRINIFGPLMNDLSKGLAIPALRDFFFNRESFDLLLDLYESKAPDSSFLDFFWTWRFMHLPLVQLLQARRAPARLCHAICTGYAGFYGALRKATEGIPLLLTEHGIYTRERTIEITQADWIHTEFQPDHVVRKTQGTFKKIWLRFFHALGQYTYETADQIVTLFDGNRKAQISHGADPAKIQIIPNGVSIEKFLGLRSERPPDPRAFRVGFVGRIVSIKDVKTFIKAAQIVLLKAPQASFYLIGPLDEEPDYAMEMQQLSADLGISSQVHFLGKQNVLEFYPKLDVVVLTSISEGQPLSLLEAMAAGIPVVATNVGGCAELLNGRDPEDKGLGRCGVITNLRSSLETATGILDICTHPETFQNMAHVGKIRVQTYYRQSDIVGRYARLYERFMKPAHPSQPPVSPKAEKAKTPADAPAEQTTDANPGKGGHS